MAVDLGKKQYNRLIIKDFIFLVVNMFANGCQKDDIWTLVENDTEVEDRYMHDHPANEGVVNALTKARLVAEIEWPPLANVPSVYGYSYLSGEMQNGLPYSLTQKVNGHVGLDVSFYTFFDSNTQSI